MRTVINEYVPYLVGAGGVAVLVFVASLFGILTRPEGLLAVLWPANALLLGAFVRIPTMNTPIGWVAAFVGYVMADLVTGSDPTKAILLTMANMVGVATGVLIIRRLRPEGDNLSSPESLLYICLSAAAAAIASGVFAIPVALIVFHSDPLKEFLFWSAADFANYVVFLPFAFTVSRWQAVWKEARIAFERVRTNRKVLLRGMPVVALLFSLVMVHAIKGPGAIVFPIPALLWCALSCLINLVAFLIMMMSLWLMVELEFELLYRLPDAADPTFGIISTRLGIAMLALGPLTVGAVDRGRLALVERLDHAAKHDYLTGLMTRGAFMPLGHKMINRVAKKNGRLTVMVMDIDNFKKVNDRYGHAAGDQILVEVSNLIKRNFRENDIFSRLGGEEFAVLMADIAPTDAQTLAQRIRKNVEEASIMVAEETSVQTTVSIGLICRELHHPVSLDGLINEADKAMYEAKETGRNRVVEH